MTSDRKLYRLYSTMLRRYLSTIDKSRGLQEINQGLRDDVSRLDESQKLVEYMDQNTKLKQRLSLFIKSSDPKTFRLVLLDKFIVRFVYLYVKENNSIYDKDKLVTLFRDLENTLKNELTSIIHRLSSIYSRK